MRFVSVTAVLALLLAGCASPKAKTEEPRETVSVRTLQLSNGADRPLPTLVYQPSRSGKLPLVLFVHGYTCRPQDYDALFRHWAASGFVVAAPTMSRTARGSSPLDIEDLINQPEDASAVLTSVLALDTTTGDPLFGKLDQAKVAAAGHSLGGMTTVGLFTKFRDERISAGIVLAGSARAVGTRGTPASLLFVHGQADRVVTIDQGKAAYDPIPWTKAFLDLPQGDHLGPYMATSSEYETVAAATTDYLQWTLRGDNQAKARLIAVPGLTLVGS